MNLSVRMVFYNAVHMGEAKEGSPVGYLEITLISAALAANSGSVERPRLRLL